MGGSMERPVVQSRCQLAAFAREKFAKNRSGTSAFNFGAIRASCWRSQLADFFEALGERFDLCTSHALSAARRSFGLRKIRRGATVQTLLPTLPARLADEATLCHAIVRERRLQWQLGPEASRHELAKGGFNRFRWALFG